MMPRILIFANGDLPDLEKARALIHDDDLLIAADGGTRHILALGLLPNMVIGDLDSISAEEKKKVDQARIEIIQFPRDKNETDLELAIQHALTLDPGQIIIIAALGHRLDQTLGNLALLSNPQLSTVALSIDDGVEQAFFCRERSQVRASRGDLISLIPWGAEVTGIVTTALKWPLQNETLYPYNTRGISNEMLGEEATIRIRSGLLLIVHRRATH